MKKIANPKDILKNTYGYDQFRPSQEDAVNAVLAGKDGLVILTTGGGKSLCFQIPALCCQGTTVVVSPLISLMKDQVDALRKKGVNAACLHSGLTVDEVTDTMLSLKQGELKMIYVAPERLLNDDFVDAIKDLVIPFVAIDEAHCVSTWGRDFRLSYMKISLFLDKISEHQGVRVPRFAYTATATPEIRDDVISQLKLEDPYIQVGDFDRPNITFNVKKSINKTDDIIELIHKFHNEPTIIYTATIKTGEVLVNDLNKLGISAGIYHGRLDSETKNRTQDMFLNDEIQVIVATNAFGMGVDKPNVRNVIHYHMPGNIENYFQEAGRAGRDGNPSKAYLLYNERDRGLQEFFIENTFPSNDVIMAVQGFFAEKGDGSIDKLSTEDIAKLVPMVIKQGQIDSVIRILEDQGVIKTQIADPATNKMVIEVLNGRKTLSLDYLAERKKNVVDNLNVMERYCKTTLCRRRSLLRYFGTKQEHKNCNTCDICLSQNKSRELLSLSVSKEAIKSVLSVISNTEQKYDASRLTDVLLGINSLSMQRRGFSKLEQFGALRSMAKVEVLNLFSKMESEHLIITPKREDGVVRLTSKGQEFLDGHNSLDISYQKIVGVTSGAEKQSIVGIKSKSSGMIDHVLYEKIERARKIFANEVSKPVSMIFDESFMKIVASSHPKSIEDLEKIGLTPGKIKLFGDRIIKLVSRHFENENTMDIEQ